MHKYNMQVLGDMQFLLYR